MIEDLEVIERSVFTEALHPRAQGKFAAKPGSKAGSKTPGHKTAAAVPAGAGKGNLSFDGKRGAGYGTPGGDKRVHSLQGALNRLGFTDGSGAKLKDDGKLGPKTTAAVKKAQRALGLKPDGVVTPALLSRLAKAKSTKDLKPAAKKAAKSTAPKKGPGIFTKPAKSTAKKAAPVTVKRSVGYSGGMTDLERHMPGRHNQQSHANRVGRTLTPSKTGLGSKAHLERKHTTGKAHVGDEVEIVGTDKIPVGHGLRGKTGRVAAYLGEGSKVEVEHPDGTNTVIHPGTLKVNRTAEELDPEDQKKKALPGYYGFYPDEARKRKKG
jgi:peptidoglycan hydrolase-like protein with peptidoglycan-binding domain